MIRWPAVGIGFLVVVAASFLAGLALGRAPIDENLYEWSPAQLKKRGVKLLPQNLAEAIDAFEQDKVIRGALGEKLAEEIITLKRMEWFEYSRHVSDWETARYLEFFLFAGSSDCW